MRFRADHFMQADDRRRGHGACPKLRQSTLRILLATAHPHIPQIAGGAQSSTHELARELAARGHQTAVLAGLTGAGWLGLRGRALLKVTGRACVRDNELGYPTWRAWHAWEGASDVKRAFQPYVALVQSGQPVKMAAAFEALGVPTAVYLRNVEEDDIGGDPRTLATARFIANSRFTAEWYRQRFGIESVVIHPLIQAESYRTETARTHVVFINPHPNKGLDVALAVAKACPDIPFLFLETWIMSGEERAALDAALAPLANVTLVPRTRDMRTVYAKARIVLAPSRWAEAFGRIAAEAQVSGIPVIASDRGGLPEAIGDGGVLVSADAPMQSWIDAVRRVWGDDAVYAGLSAKARAHAERPALDRAQQIAALLSELEGAMAPASVRARASA